MSPQLPSLQRVNNFGNMWVKETNYQLKLVNQIFLFINFNTSIAWFVSTCIVLYHSTTEAFFSTLNFPVICFVIGCPVEGLRIYLGYSGNIKNNVSCLLNAVKFKAGTDHFRCWILLVSSSWPPSLSCQSIFTWFSRSLNLSGGFHLSFNLFNCCCYQLRFYSASLLSALHYTNEACNFKWCSAQTRTNYNKLFTNE